MSTNTNLSIDVLNNNYVVPLNHQSGIVVTGLEAKKFLQGQITSNIETISDHHGQLSAHCTAKGWVISLFTVLQLADDTYFLRMPSNLCSKAKQTLSKFALFSKVALSENQNWHLLGVAGPQALAILKSVLNQDLPDLAPQDKITLTHDQEKMVIFREIGTVCRYVLLLPQSLLNTFLSQLKQQTTLLSSAAWDLWDIQMGIPSVYPETSEKALAPYFNLESLNAISFDKGCYLGQEVIARMHYRGKIKKHMYRASVVSQTLPTAGIDVILASGESKGFVVRVAPFKPNEYEMLVILDDELSAFENIFLFSKEKPKLSRLELPYSV